MTLDQNEELKWTVERGEVEEADILKTFKNLNCFQVYCPLIEKALRTWFSHSLRMSGTNTLPWARPLTAERSHCMYPYGSFQPMPAPCGSAAHALQAFTNRSAGPFDCTGFSFQPRQRISGNNETKSGCLLQRTFVQGLRNRLCARASY